MTLPPASPELVPAARPRMDSAERTRLLIAAAYDLLAEDGLDGLTIRAVLQRTGLARRAFYESFAGKDELVLAVFEETLQLAARHFTRLTAAMGDALERVGFIVTSIVLRRGYDPDDSQTPHDRRAAALSREHIRLAESHPAQLQAALQPLMGVIAQAMAEGMAAGIIRRADPDLMASLVYNLVATTVHTELIATEGLSGDADRHERMAAEIWEFCRRAISA